MSRPMILMQEPVLSDLWYRRGLGVPVTALIQQSGLSITPPTLKKLLSYMNLLECEATRQESGLYDTIYASLFPDWLLWEAGDDPDDGTGVLVSQPTGWIYEGQFPLGYWVPPPGVELGGPRPAVRRVAEELADEQ